MAAEGMPFPWRWISGTISANLDVIWGMSVYPPTEGPRSGDRQADAKAIMGELNEQLEERVRERPEQWMWLHRRWGKELYISKPARSISIANAFVVEAAIHPSRRIHLRSVSLRRKLATRHTPRKRYRP